MKPPQHPIQAAEDPASYSARCNGSAGQPAGYNDRYNRMRYATNYLQPVWHRRRNKRERAVAAIKKTPAYIVVNSSSSMRISTPDPDDRTVGKRTWEQSMQEWRKNLREELQCIHRKGTTIQLTPEDSNEEDYSDADTNLQQDQSPVSDYPQLQAHVPRRCEVCERFARVPYRRCWYCKAKPCYHHGVCCPMNEGITADAIHASGVTDHIPKQHDYHDVSDHEDGTSTASSSTSHYAPSLTTMLPESP